MPRKKEFRITPKKYQQILKGVEIQSISLIALSYECDRDEIQKNPVKLSLKTDASMGEQDSGYASVIFNFTLTGTAAKKIALKISGKYQTEFKTIERMSEDFLDVFKEYSLRFLMTPYLRDLFYNLSMRSDLPGIILPLLKFFPTEKKLS